jgi:hypothetical protein
MAISARFTRGDVTADGVVMLSLGLLLFALEPFMVIPETELNGYRAAVILTAGALLFGGIHLTRLMRGSATRLRITYGLVTELLVGCWAACWIIQSSPLDLRFLVLLAGAHGIVWGIWLLKLAIQVRMLAIRAPAVSLLGAGTSAAGIAIAVSSGLTRITALNLVACYTVCIGIVLLSLEVCLFRSFLPQELSPVAKEILQQNHERSSSFSHVVSQELVRQFTLFHALLTRTRSQEKR